MNRSPHDNPNKPTDADRFTTVYGSTSGPILSYFLRRLSSPLDAADAVADVFTVVWRRIDEVPDGDQARLWVFGIARLTLQNETRRRRRTNALAERLRVEIGTHGHVPSAADTPAGKLVDALRSLSADDRELMMLTGWDGLTTAEAAVVLDIEPGTLRVRLHRARSRLRERLAEPHRHPPGNRTPVASQLTSLTPLTAMFTPAAAKDIS